MTQEEAFFDHTLDFFREYKKGDKITLDDKEFTVTYAFGKARTFTHSRESKCKNLKCECHFGKYAEIRAQGLESTKPLSRLREGETAGQCLIREWQESQAENA